MKHIAWHMVKQGVNGWQTCNIGLTNQNDTVLGKEMKCSYWLSANGTVHAANKLKVLSFSHKPLGFLTAAKHTSNKPVSIKQSQQPGIEMYHAT